MHKGKRYGIEFKLKEDPEITKSMRIAINDLNLEHLWIVYPGTDAYPVEKKISVCPISNIAAIKAGIG